VNIKDPFSEKIENAKNKGDYDVLLKASEEALKKEPGNTVLLEKRAKLHEKFQQ
jgi:hypothetical protein